MRQDGRTARPATATQGLPAMTNRHGDQPPDGPWRRPPDQTSTPESPAIAPSPKRRDRTGRPRHPAFRSQHESRPEDQTTDESGRADPETRSRGCSQVSLYNTRRPHQALGHRSPMTIWREAAFANAAVDMTLAWTTLARCPHAHSRNSNN